MCVCTRARACMCMCARALMCPCRMCNRGNNNLSFPQSRTPASAYRCSVCDTAQVCCSLCWGPSPTPSSFWSPASESLGKLLRNRHVRTSPPPLSAYMTKDIRDGYPGPHKTAQELACTCIFCVMYPCVDRHAGHIVLHCPRAFIHYIVLVYTFNTLP